MSPPNPDKQNTTFMLLCQVPYTHPRPRRHGTTRVGLKNRSGPGFLSFPETPIIKCVDLEPAHASLTILTKSFQEPPEIIVTANVKPFNQITHPGKEDPVSQGRADFPVRAPKKL